MADAARPARWNATAITASATIAEREVDVEDPAPREVVDEEAAEQRADHGRDAEDGAEEPLVLAALARRDDVADDRDRRHDQPAAAEALDARGTRSARPMFCAQPAERRADEEDHDRRLEHDLAAVEVAELPVERADDRRGEQVRGDDPREVLDARRGRRRSSAARSRRSSGRATARSRTSSSAPKIRRTRGASCGRAARRRMSAVTLTPA